MVIGRNPALARAELTLQSTVAILLDHINKVLMDHLGISSLLFLNKVIFRKCKCMFIYSCIFMIKATYYTLMYLLRGLIKTERRILKDVFF